MLLNKSDGFNQEPWHSVTWQPGWVTLLHGPNGAGKTTWLRHLAAAWAPIYYSGHNLGWIPHLTVEDNINLWNQTYSSSSLLRATSVAQQSKNLHGSLRRYSPREDNDLTTSTRGNNERNIPFSHQQWGDLSQGQKQYVAFIGARASGCPLWLMDEPFAHMDADHTQQSQAMCRDHLENGGAMVMTSHAPTIDFWPHIKAWNLIE